MTTQKTLLSLFLCSLPFAVHAQEEGRTAVSISPAAAWFTDEEPFGSFRISNIGTRLAEVEVSAAFGLIEDSRDGEQQGVTFDVTADTLRDLTPHLDVYPPNLILEPGESKIVRYQIWEMETMPEGGYMTIISYLLNQRSPLIEGQIPEGSATMAIRYVLVAPLVFVKGGGKPVIEVDPLTRTDSTLALFLRNQTDIPWKGLLTLGSVEGNEVYGEEPVSVYTQRRAEVTVAGNLPDEVRVMFRVNARSGDRGFGPSVTPPEDVIVTL